MRLAFCRSYVSSVDPALGEDVAHRAGDRLEALAGAGRREGDHVVEEQMPLVEAVVRPRELNRATPVLFEKAIDRCRVRAHGPFPSGPSSRGARLDDVSRRLRPTTPAR